MIPLASVFGLPLHPLVVHAVVVLLPLGALALIASILIPRVRENYATVSVALVAIGFASAIVAKLSGGALAEVVGLPEEHEEAGDRTALVAFLLLAVAIGWWWLQRRAAQRGVSDRVETVQRILGGAGVLLAVVALVFTTLAGHSGASEVWEKRLAMGGGTVSAAPAPPGDRGEDGDEAEQAPVTPAPAPTPTPGVPTPTPTPTASPTPTGPVYRMAEVEEHNYRASCWAVVNGGVYDLTNWIRQHPGGQQRILNLCGTDATGAFFGQHGASQRPNTQLDSMRIGTLVN